MLPLSIHKDRYRNQTQLLSVARGYKARKLPISMIVIDWFHWEQMGDWKLNPACWPDPQGMVDELRSMGIELMVTFWPYVGQYVSKHWDEFNDNRYLLINASAASNGTTADSVSLRAPTPLARARFLPRIMAKRWALADLTHL